MSSTASLLLPPFIAVLCVLSASCLPVTSDLRSIISGVADRDWAASAGEGRHHLVKRQLSINADANSLARMLMAQQAEDDRRNQDFLRRIGKRGGLEVDLLPRAAMDDLRLVRYLVPSSENSLEDGSSRMW